MFLKPTESVPSTVQFDSVPLVGVPRTGVTKVGDVANTKEPEPVSSVTAAAMGAMQILEQAAITVVGALVGMLATEGLARQTQPLTDLRVPAVAVVVGEAAMAVLAAAASASWVRALAV